MTRLSTPVRALLPQVPLRTDDVELRPWRSGDEGVRVEAGADPDIRRWTTVRRDADQPSAAAWIDWAERAREEAEALTVDELTNADGDVVGSVHSTNPTNPADLAHILAAYGRLRGMAREYVRTAGHGRPLVPVQSPPALDVAADS